MTGKMRRPFRRRPLHGVSVRRAFTLVELLVVISIFVLVLAIAIPAFSTMLYNSEQAMAENGLRIALSAARDAALRSSAGQDAAAVFTYDPGGRLTIVPCVKAGDVIDVENMVDPPKLVRRDVFVPQPGYEPIQLPSGWMVRAYAPAGSINPEWYEKTYPGAAERQRGNWIFPESGFYDTERSAAAAGADGDDRQTFMVRFAGATGKLSVSDPTPVLVFSPSPGPFRTLQPWASFRADRESEQGRFIRRVSAAPLPMQDKFDMLGNQSSDTILARSVGQLAIYSESRLASAVGARTDSATGTIYERPGQSNDWGPRLVASGPGVVDTRDVNEWIEGRLTSGGRPVPSDARLFAIHPYLGWLQEVTGTRPLPGVP